MPLYRSFVLRVSHFPQDESTVRPIKKFNGFAVLDFSIWFYKKKNVGKPGDMEYGTQENRGFQPQPKPPRPIVDPEAHGEVDPTL